MKVTLESTAQIVELDTAMGGRMPARLWVGQTENGIAVHAFITRIAVHKDDDASQFERELSAAHVEVPDHLRGVYPARLVIG